LVAPTAVYADLGGAEQGGCQPLPSSTLCVVLIVALLLLVSVTHWQTPRGPYRLRAVHVALLWRG